MTKRNRKSDDSAIEQRKGDGYINATRLCKIHGDRTGERKEPSEWLSNKSTKSIIEKLSSVTGIPGQLLATTKQRGVGQGTWLHPRLAVRFTMWLDEEFSLQIEDLVQTWIKSDATRKANLTPWGKVRLQGKETRRKFTDAVQDYIYRRPAMNENDKTYMYARATNRAYEVLFGRDAKQLMRDFGVSTGEALRDAMTDEELNHVKEMESLAMRLVDSQDLHPCRAVEEAGFRLLIPVSSRALLN